MHRENRDSLGVPVFLGCAEAGLPRSSICARNAWVLFRQSHTSSGKRDVRTNHRTTKRFQAAYDVGYDMEKFNLYLGGSV